MIFLSDFFTAETHLPTEVCSEEVITFQRGSPILRGFLMFMGKLYFFPESSADSPHFFCKEETKQTWTRGQSPWKIGIVLSTTQCDSAYSTQV